MFWNILPNNKEESAEAKSCTHKDLTLQNQITDTILPHLCQMDGYSPWSSIVYEFKFKLQFSTNAFCHQLWGLIQCPPNESAALTRPTYSVALGCTTHIFTPSHWSSVSPCHTCSICLELLFTSSLYPMQIPRLHHSPTPTRKTFLTSAVH